MVGQFLRRSRPTLAIVMETEIWPNLYAGCSRIGVPLLMANARLSDKSFKAYSRLRLLVCPTLRRVALGHKPLVELHWGLYLFVPSRAALKALDAVAHLSDAAGAEAQFLAQIAANRRDFEARFSLARLRMAQQRWTDAMDELLEILMRDKAWNSDLARKTFIAILDIIDVPKPKVAEGQIPPEDPTVATYRRRLSSVVLS